MAGRIFVTGDTHGFSRIRPGEPDGFVPRFSNKNFPEAKELDAEDFVVICGDFGGVWDFDARYTGASAPWLNQTQRFDHGESSEEHHQLDWLAERKGTYLFCGGNHENYDRLLGAYEEVDFHGGRAMRLRENLYYLEDGYVFSLAGRSVFVMGGASTHDIQDGILDPDAYDTRKAYRAACRRLDQDDAFYRVRYVSWWSREIPGQQERERGRKNLRACGNRCDLILTHCLPTSLQAQLTGNRYSADTLTDYLEEIYRSVHYGLWCCGHYHMDRALPGNVQVLYGKILQI